MDILISEEANPDEPSTSRGSSSDKKSIQKKVPQREETSDEESESAFSLRDSDDSFNFHEESSDIEIHTQDSSIPSTIKSDYNQGDFVVVNFEGQFFPRKVTEKIPDGVVVSAMEKSGHHWKWPLKPDVILYSEEEVLFRIDSPKKMNNRGLFKVIQLDDF